MGRFSSLKRIREEAEQASAYLIQSSSMTMAKAPGSGLAALAGNIVGGSQLFETNYKVAEHQEQYRHYRGWVYTAVKTIANRLAGQAYAMGKRLNGKKSSKGSKVFQPNSTELLPGHLKSHLMATEIEMVAEHELLDALRRPNLHMVAWSLFYSTAASLMLTGRSFWWMTRTEDGRLEITPVPAHWVTFVYAESGKFLHYEVKRPNTTTEPIPVEPKDMLFFPFTDPADPFSTISPLQTQATAVAIDESIQTAQFRAFKNGIFPGVLLRVGKIDGIGGMPGELPLLDGAQRRDLVAAVQALYGGVLNYGDPLILDALIEGVEKLTHSPQEMDFLDSGEAVKKRIFQAFGVNPIITGQTDGANRAQAAVADGIFSASVINPMADLIGQVVSAWIARYGGTKDKDLMFWIEPSRPNDDELRLKEWMAGLTNLVVTPDEYRMNVLNLGPQSEEEKKQLKELMALRIMGKPNAGGSASSSGGGRTPSGDSGNQRS